MRSHLRIILYCIFIMLLAIGCTDKIDINVEIEAVRKADSDWLQAASDKDIDQLLSFYDNDAMWLLPNEPIIRGKEAIRKRWSQWFEVPGSFITWKPIKVEVSSSGDLAYSLGTFDARYKNKDGEIVNFSGEYVAVWKKMNNTQWKLAVDISN